MARFSSLLVGVVAFVLLACPGSPPTPDPTLVYGTRVVHWVGPSALADVPQDPIAVPLKAFVLKDGAFEPVKVVYTGDGGFTLAVAPGTDYYVGSAGSFLVTAARQLDLGTNRQGRPDAVEFDAGGPQISINVTGMFPWSEQDSLSLVSESVAEQAGLYWSPGIPKGATEVLTTPVAYYPSSAVHPSGVALEASKGDQGYLLQRRSTYFSDGGSTGGWDTVIASGPTGLLTTGEQRMTQLSATLKPTSQTPISIDLRISAWTAMAPSVHPSASYLGMGFEVDAVTRDLDRGRLGAWNQILVGFIADDLTDGVYPMTYGNPISSSAEVAALRVGFGFKVQVPGTNLHVIGVHARSIDSISALLTSPLAPEMSPPQSLKIDGADAQAQPLTLTSATPTISWSGPTLGTPTHYLVSFRKLSVDPSMRILSPTIGTILVKETTVRVPPDFIPAGLYVLTVDAEDASGGGFSSTSAPNYDPIRARGAEAVSTQFTVP